MVVVEGEISEVVGGDVAIVGSGSASPRAMEEFSFGDSPCLEPSLPRPCGRPKKKQEVKWVSLAVPRQLRGRPKNSKYFADKENVPVMASGVVVEDNVGAEPIGRELMVFLLEPSEHYGIMTRARSAIFMGKHLGMCTIARMMFPTTKSQPRSMSAGLFRLANLLAVSAFGFGMFDQIVKWFNSVWG